MSGGSASFPILELDNLRRQADRLRQAASLLGRGQVAAVPTEVGHYAVARSDREESLTRLRLGGQERAGWLTLLVPDLSVAAPYVRELPPRAGRLAERFWPGPLILHLARSGSASPTLSSGLSKVALFCPFHPLVQGLVRQCATFQLAATPLPLVLRPEAAPRPQVREQATRWADFLLEWKDPPLDLEPTEVDLTGSQARVTRLGFVTVEELQLALGSRPILSGDVATPARFTRYAPEVRVILVEGDPERIARRLKFLRETYCMTERVLLVVCQESAQRYFAGASDVLALGSREDPERLGSEVQRTLTEIDRVRSASLVLVEGIPREGAGMDVMEQLSRTAHQVINTEDPGFAGQAGMQPRRQRKK